MARSIKRIGSLSSRGAKCRRTCASWKKVKSGKLRCAKFRPVKTEECALMRAREAQKGTSRSR